MLKLTDGEIDSSQIQHLADALQKNNVISPFKNLHSRSYAFQTLITLDLSSTKMDYRGARALAAALPHNKVTFFL